MACNCSSVPGGTADHPPVLISLRLNHGPRPDRSASASRVYPVRGWWTVVWSFLISLRLNFPRRPFISSSSHRRVVWHPDEQDHYGDLISMRLFTVPSLYFQVLGIGASRFQYIADLRIAPWGSFVVLALTAMRLLLKWTRCDSTDSSIFGWKGGLVIGKNYEILEKSAFRWRKSIKRMDCIRQRNTLSKTEMTENIGERSLLQSIIWKLAWPIWACPITSSDADVNSR